MRTLISRLLLLSIPLALVLWTLNRVSGFAGHFTGAVFAVALLALIPLAGRIGSYTDVLEIYLGDRLGGLVAAAFSNIPELTIGVALLLQARLSAADPVRRGDALDIAHSMLVGSMVNNLLFTLGVAILPATLAYGQLRFRSTGDFFLAALALAVVGLGLPAVVTAVNAGAASPQVTNTESTAFSVILILSYVGYLAFAVFGLEGGRKGQPAVLQKNLTIAEAREAAQDEAEAREDERQRLVRAELRRSHPEVVRSALLGLAVVSIATAAMAGVLVSVTEQVITDTPLTPLSVGFILFPIVNNLGEQAGAVTEALHGKMEEALTIPAGSAVQVAFLVTPILVLLSFPLGGFDPALVLSLLFQPAQLILLVTAVFIFAVLTIHGKATWLHGVQLLTLYTLIALVAFTLPGR